VIRHDRQQEGGTTPFAESLLILGLEGSRDESFTLWVFNAAIHRTGSKKRKKWRWLEVKNLALE
jgi:hypothetical protein